MSGQEKHFYEFGPFRLDPSKRRLLRDGEPVPLTPKAFDTLLALVRQSGRTVEKDDLMRLVWPGAAVEENNLNQNITALRKTLGDSRHESRYIATIPGLGYRFVADVREVEETPLAPAEAEGTTPEPARPQQPSPERLAPAEAKTIAVNGTRAGALRLSLLILAPLALAALAYALYARREVRPPPPSVASLAVLPLEDLSGDPAQEYFADGMTDALIGDLARIGELRVISRTSSMHYKGAKKSLPEIAGELKVDAVVEGTVQRSGGRVRIRVHGPSSGWRRPTRSAHTTSPGSKCFPSWTRCAPTRASPTSCAAPGCRSEVMVTGVMTGRFRQSDNHALEGEARCEESQIKKLTAPDRFRTIPATLRPASP